MRLHTASFSASAASVLKGHLENCFGGSGQRMFDCNNNRQLSAVASTLQENIYIYIYIYYVYCSSSVGIAIAYGLDGPGIESRWGRDFPHLSRPALRSTQPPVQGVLGLSRG